MRIMDMITQMNLPDISSTSPHYVCGKWLRVTKENSNFDLWVYRVYNVRSIIQPINISCFYAHENSKEDTLPLPGVHCRFTSSRSSLRLLSLRLTVSTRFWYDNSTKKFKIINDKLLHSQGKMYGTK